VGVTIKLVCSICGQPRATTVSVLQGAGLPPALPEVFVVYPGPHGWVAYAQKTVCWECLLREAE